MTDVETRVRLIVQEYLVAFVNTPTLLRMEATRRNTFEHLRDRVSEKYREKYDPSPLAWNFEVGRAVQAAVQVCVEELLRNGSLCKEQT